MANVRRIMHSESRRDRATDLFDAAKVLLREGRRQDSSPWIEREMRHGAATCIDAAAIVYKEEGHEKAAERLVHLGQRIRMGNGVTSSSRHYPVLTGEKGQLGLLVDEARRDNVKVGWGN